MSTSSVLQTFSAKHFLIGLVIGVGSEIILSIAFSLVPVLISIISLDTYLDTFYNNNSNMQLLGISLFLARLILFTALLFVLQKKLKNKLITIGVATGFITSMILTAMIIPQLIG